jgi:hypothetical protein
MNFFKLTASASLCVALSAAIISCQKDDIKDRENAYAKSDILMTGAQISPSASPSTGTGKLTVNYDKRTKVLNYVITWSGLSDSIIAIRVNGPAPVGFSSLNPAFTGASPTSFTTTPYNVIQQFTGTAPKAMLAASGTYTGTLSVDDVKVKEQDLLNSLYYVTLHTKTTLPIAAPGSFLYRWFGEVRAQITFQ